MASAGEAKGFIHIFRILDPVGGVGLSWRAVWQHDKRCDLGCSVRHAPALHRCQGMHLLAIMGTRLGSALKILAAVSQLKSQWWRALQSGLRQC